MKYLLLAIGVLLVISGIVSVNLWLDLRTERLENTRLTAQLTESSKAPGAPTTSVQPVATAAATGVANTSVATGGPAPLPTNNEAAMKATAASVSAGAAAAERESHPIVELKARKASADRPGQPHRERAVDRQRALVR